jgi:hypothetical protein
MKPEFWIALAALVISIIAFYRSERTQRALQKLQATDASIHTNISTLVEVWSSIARKPTVLRFHGVTDEELTAAGIDAEELAYLIASFETASHYYDHIENQTGSFPEESIRYAMCASAPTQKAWPVVKRFFASNSPYFKKIEETIMRCSETQRVAARPLGAIQESQRPTQGLKRTPDGAA